MDKIVHLILFIFIGALLVLVVTHAAGFSTAVNAVGGQVTNDAALLAGYTPSTSGGFASPQSVNMLGSAPTGSNVRLV